MQWADLDTAYPLPGAIPLGKEKIKTAEKNLK